MLVFIAVLFVALFAPSLAYYAWMKSKAIKDWGLIINQHFQPKISIIIPTYNEAVTIRKKLENIQEMDYPTDKLQVIVVDSASIDGTISVCRSFLEEKSLRFPNIILLSEKERMGKSHALNTALEYAEGEIVATSDADSFWESDALSKAVSFFADPSIGAITGREELINLKKTVHTLSEGLYRKFYYTLRLGESKVDSTFIFQGELSLYRKDALRKFESRPGYSDDVGTVVNIISRGYKCIFVPEAVFHDTAAYSLRGRLMLKSRRAQHLIAGILESSKLKLEGKFSLASSIIFFNFYMHIISPLLFVFVTAFTIALVFLSYWFLIFLILPLFIFRKPRLLAVSYLTSNLALLLGLFWCVFGKKDSRWQKIEEMRTFV
jgi:biofilm PGA synthesis N-glycosyltransferase PgaC